MNHISLNPHEQLIEAVNQADSADNLLEAVEALAEVRSPQAIPTLIEVLGYNNPGAAVAAVEGLINIGEPAVPHLLENLDDYNYGARAWAIRVFAGIGDPQALDLLLKAASSDFSLSVRRAAARGLGFIKWSKLPASKIDAAQKQVLETLLLVTKDGEWVVRYASVVGLEQLALTVTATKVDFIRNIETTFRELINCDSEIAVKARIKLALSKIEKIYNSEEKTI